MPAPSVRHFGPATRGTILLERQLYRTIRPLARDWRLTPRGIALLRALTEPRTRVPVVRGTRIEQTAIGGRPAEWVRAPRAAGVSGRSILYLHGGGYVILSPRGYRTLTSRLSQLTGAQVLAIDYRLAPEHPLADGAVDALAAYRHLRERGDEVVVAGDSAGGGLTFRLALAIAEDGGLPQPAGLATFSPWTDLTLSGRSYISNGEADPFIHPRTLARFAAAAVRGGGDRADWRLSPVLAPDELLAQLPPSLCQVGSTEILLDDSTRMAERLAAAGVPAEVQIFDRQPHVPPLYANRLARESLREFGAFVARVLPPVAAPQKPTRADAAVAVAETG